MERLAHALLQVGLFVHQCPIIATGYYVASPTVEAPLIAGDFSRRPYFQNPAEIKSERTRLSPNATVDGNKLLPLQIAKTFVEFRTPRVAAR